MADWLYLFTENTRYPEPLAEISALSALVDDGKRVFLLLPNRKAPPMSSAEAGQEILLCTRVGRRLVKHAIAVVGAAARVEPTTPNEVKSLYGETAGRMFIQLAGIRMVPQTSVDELSVDEQATFASGQAYVRRVALESRPRSSNSRPKAGSAGGSLSSLIPRYATVNSAMRNRATATQCAVIGVDPTAGDWSAGMTKGRKQMPSVALRVDTDGRIAAHSSLLDWHTSNEALWKRVADVAPALTCIDGPCDTNGLELAADWSHWNPQCTGQPRGGERALALLGVGLFWTTHATIVGFDGASRWIARSLRLFSDSRAMGSPFQAIETHPHGAFRFLRLATGQSPDLHNKGSRYGRAERLEILNTFITGVRDSDLPNHDSVDAACAALVAALHCLGWTRSFGSVNDGGEIWMPDPEVIGARQRAAPEVFISRDQ